jgi:cytochrome c551/c552
MRTMFATVLTAALITAVAVWPQAAAQHAPAGPPPALATADACIACHTGITSREGDDVSFVSAWRPSMMANSARDPYWHAGVRREVMDHPTATAAIEGECSACHMPMAAYLARHGGGHGEVFTNLPAGVSMAPHADLAADGVSCTVCHQITPEALGTRASFNAHFRLGVAAPGASPVIGGPFDVDAGRKRLMRSSSGYEPARADHLSESDVCGSCHTLYTSSLGPKGEVVGELPEQMPYIEWKHSAYRTTRSCQSCHMPLVSGQVPVTPVLGEPRPNVSQHTFVGGNFFMQRMLNRHRSEQGVPALPEELDASARRTLEYLASDAASLSLASARLAGGRGRAQLRRAQAADGLSVPPRVAAPGRPRRLQGRGLRIGRDQARRRHRRQRQ